MRNFGRYVTLMSKLYVDRDPQVGFSFLVCACAYPTAGTPRQGECGPRVHEDRTKSNFVFPIRFNETSMCICMCEYMCAYVSVCLCVCL